MDSSMSAFELLKTGWALFGGTGGRSSLLPLVVGAANV